MTNPLDGYNFTMAKDSGMYQYYIKVHSILPSLLCHPVLH